MKEHIIQLLMAWPHDSHWAPYCCDPSHENPAFAFGIKGGSDMHPPYLVAEFDGEHSSANLDHFNAKALYVIEDELIRVGYSLEWKLDKLGPRCYAVGQERFGSAGKSRTEALVRLAVDAFTLLNAAQ